MYKLQEFFFKRAMHSSMARLYLIFSLKFFPPSCRPKGQPLTRSSIDLASTIYRLPNDQLGSCFNARQIFNYSCVWRLGRRLKANRSNSWQPAILPKRKSRSTMALKATQPLTIIWKLFGGFCLFFLRDSRDEEHGYPRRTGDPFQN
jgi:hypothetical protein